MESWLECMYVCVEKSLLVKNPESGAKASLDGWC